MCVWLSLNKPGSLHSASFLSCTRKGLRVRHDGSQPWRRANRMKAGGTGTHPLLHSKSPPALATWNPILNPHPKGKLNVRISGPVQVQEARGMLRSHPGTVQLWSYDSRRYYVFIRVQLRGRLDLLWMLFSSVPFLSLQPRAPPKREAAGRVGKEQWTQNLLLCIHPAESGLWPHGSDWRRLPSRVVTP